MKKNDLTLILSWFIKIQCPTLPLNATKKKTKKKRKVTLVLDGQFRCCLATQQHDILFGSKMKDPQGLYVKLAYSWILGRTIYSC